VSDAWLRALVALPFGLVIGSFMTVVTARVPAGESIISPRSRCPHCGTEIRNRDNVPVLGWVLLRGKCHACGERISPLYPFLELVTGVLVAAAFYVYEDLLIAGAIAALLVLMPAIAVIDIQHRIIPNKLMYPSLVAFPAYLVVARLLGAPVDLVRMVVGFLVYGGGLLVVALISRGMGMGDVKLAALIGAALGWSVAVAILGALLAGAVFAVAVLVREGMSARKKTIPYGPFIAFGGIVVMLLGGR
jgi:leader peptidase (prepilin peptidase)/N-methyltransferase